MKRSLAVFLIAAFAALSVPANGSAQIMIGVGAGATLPLGDFADFDGDGGSDQGANAGWLAAAGVGIPLGDAGVSVGASGFYGSNGHDTDGDKTNLYGGLAGVSYAFGNPESASPFIGGLVGFMTHSYKSESQPALEGSESGLAYGAYGGVGFPLGGVSGFAELYWLKGAGDIDGTTFAGAMVGVQFPVGGGGM